MRLLASTQLCGLNIKILIQSRHYYYITFQSTQLHILIRTENGTITPSTVTNGAKLGWHWAVSKDGSECATESEAGHNSLDTRAFLAFGSFKGFSPNPNVNVNIPSQ